jgi:hypothetical protein
MTTVTIELPEDLTIELQDRHIPNEIVHRIAIQAIKDWLHSEGGTISLPPPENTDGNVSPFAESAIPFVDKLIDENRSLFDRLAKLPDDA